MSYIQPGGILDSDDGELGGNTFDLGPNRGTLAAGVVSLDNSGQRILQVSARNARISQEFTLSFNCRILRESSSIANHFIRALVQWGSAKGKNAVLLDLKHGARVCLEGAYCNVDAQYAFSPIPAGSAVNAGPDVEVSCSISPGTAAPQPNTLTVCTGEVAVGITTEIVIPSYAYALVIQSRRNPAVAPAAVIQSSFGSATAASGGKRTISISDELWAPILIPNGAEVVDVQNVGPATNEINAVFQLMI